MIFQTLLKRFRKEQAKPLEQRIQSGGHPYREPAIFPVLSSEERALENLIHHGKPFYDRNLAKAFQAALAYAAPSGKVASLPYLIAGKAKADKENYLWQNWFDAFSEENIGIDTTGNFVRKGEAVVIIVHGGGILMPERIFQAYDEGLTKGAAKYAPEEFDALLNGVLPKGEQISIYSIDDIKGRKIPNPFGRYAVALPFETAKATKSGWLSKEEFLENPLVWARVGTLDYLEDYFEKAKGELNGNFVVGNWHPFGYVNPDQSQGRVLFVNDSDNGLYGFSFLGYYGRFVWVGAGGASHER